MSQIPELPQPGVEVIQEFQAATPSIVVPTLVPSVVGVAKEIRELYDEDNNLNSDIRVSGAAVATAPNAEPYNLANKSLELRVNGGVVQTFSFGATATALTAQELASLIISATPAPTDFSAYVYEDSLAVKYLQLRTNGAGADKSIQFVDTDASVVLGYGYRYTYYGLGTYQQDAVYLKQESFPDPRGNLSELDIDEDSIRVFLDLSTSVVELLKTEAFLRKGTTIAPVDDLDGDQVTPYVAMAGTDFKAMPGSAVVTGGIDLNSNRQEINQQVLAIKLDGGSKQFIKFYGIAIISDAAAGWVWLNITGGALNFSVNGAAVSIASVVAATLQNLVIEINVASQAAIGADIAYESNAAGTKQAPGAGTHLGILYGADPTAIDKDSAVVVLDTSTPALLNEIFGALGTSGTGDDITQDTPVAGTATLDDAGGAFTADMVGKNITIAGAAAPGNNGTFPITAVNGATQIEFTNVAAVTVVADGFTYIVHSAIEQPLWGDHTTVNGGALAGGPFENQDIEAQIDAMFGTSFASMSGSDELDRKSVV